MKDVALASYVKNAERMHAPFEKSPKDYIALFNAKGFYFVKGEKGFEVKSIYTDNRTSCPLPKRTSQYLNTIPNLSETLKEQATRHQQTLLKSGRNNLENLWAGHLMERGMYDKVAFMLTAEKVYPNLHREMVQHHMDNGLRESVNDGISEAFEYPTKPTAQKRRLCHQFLIGRVGARKEEVFNGFKDEFTDFTKLKGKAMVWGLGW